MKERLSNLYKASQQSRKAFRLGKSVTYVKKIQKTFDDDKTLSPWQRYLSFIQNTGMVIKQFLPFFSFSFSLSPWLTLYVQFGFFIYDNVVFISRAKVYEFDVEEAGKRGGILWFCANIAGFILAMNNLNAVSKGLVLQIWLTNSLDEWMTHRILKKINASAISLRQKRFVFTLDIERYWKDWRTDSFSYRTNHVFMIFKHN